MTAAGGVPGLAHRGFASSRTRRRNSLGAYERRSALGCDPPAGQTRLFHAAAPLQPCRWRCHATTSATRGADLGDGAPAPRHPRQGDGRPAHLRAWPDCRTWRSGRWMRAVSRRPGRVRQVARGPRCRRAACDGLREHQPDRVARLRRSSRCRQPCEPRGGGFARPCPPLFAEVQVRARQARTPARRPRRPRRARRRSVGGSR